MAKKRVIISCGPIPARLDSVKFLTNRFKGGLAYETARRLAKSDMDVTIIKWAHTSSPWDAWEIKELGIRFVNVIDVVEYAQWFEDHAAEYDAFVMAAAVANLMPSNPYETKFPSHHYKVGEKFDIQFEIAPRAIDIVKRVNPRCCLIGYKLFDTTSDEELIDIARHILEDAKANVIFANRPSDAKSKKIAVTADGAAIPMTFDEHIEFMKKAIYAEYFKTEFVDTVMESRALKNAIALTQYFEQTFPHFGTVAFRVPTVGMVTTCRGHKGNPVIVTDVDFENRIVKCAKGTRAEEPVFGCMTTFINMKKATLNAPLLWKMLEENPAADYIIHRHDDDPLAHEGYSIPTVEVDYEFPGTMEEVNSYTGLHSCGLIIKHHGYVIPMTMKDVNWNKYYEMFPKRYFGTRKAIEGVLRYAETHPELESLELGGNTTCRCKYNLDPNMEGDNVLSYDELDEHKFDIIVARNSINYLSVEELKKVLSRLKLDGVFIANSFAKVPSTRIRCEEDRREVAVSHFITDGEKHVAMIDHFLMLHDVIYPHSFYGRDEAAYRNLGFDVVQDGGTILIRKGTLKNP